jgi:hypothetical protein
MFTGNEDQQITLAEGSSFTAKFRAWLATTGSLDLTIGEYHSRRTLETILAQEDCVGMRSYYGMDAEGNRRLVLVGVTADENDQVELFIGDRSYKSPPHTGAANLLNS